MRRRAFITLLGGAAAWPLAARAQQQAMPVIGFVRSTSFAETPHFVTAFHQGLRDTGFVEGQNVTTEFRAAEGQLDRLPALIEELIRRPVAVIVGNFNAALAAKTVTATVPIVFATGNDPVRDGLVASLNRPGGNVTGINFFNDVLGTKRLELLREMVPGSKTIAMLVHPNTFNTELERNDARAAALALGQQLITLEADDDGDIETAFTTFVERGASALLLGSGAFMNSKRNQIVALAARHRLPTSYLWREAVLSGGLMSYGPSQVDAYRQAGIYVGRILKGEKPGDLPVMRSTKFELILNLKTARTLGLAVPDRLLALADETVD